MLGEDTFVIALDGMAATRSLENLPAHILRAAGQAINKTADRTRTASAKSIREQVAFPASYLNPGEGRLVVSSRASADNLEAVIGARTRATSLARFVTSGSVGKMGVTVQVAPGFAKYMKRAFLIRLPAGRSGEIETKSNLGLAIRLKPGETLTGRRTAVQKKGNLYFLYGPSVSQVFNTVREDVSPDAADYLATEFSRLLDLDLPQ